MTAIKLAERVTRDHGVPAVAIFWIESEDHDWEEVSSCSVFDAEMHRRTITLGTPPGAGEGPVAGVRLDPSVMAAVEGLRATLPGTEFTDGVLLSLAEAYRPGIGMSDAFGRWLESVLGRLGLVVYDSAEPGDEGARGRRSSPASSSRRRRPRGWRRSRARRCRQPATTRRSSRTPTTWRCSSWTASGRRCTSARAPSSSATPPWCRRPRWWRNRASTRSDSAPTSCCGRSCRTRCSRRSATSPARTNSPTSRS